MNASCPSSTLPLLSLHLHPSLACLKAPHHPLLRPSLSLLSIYLASHLSVHPRQLLSLFDLEKVLDRQARLVNHPQPPPPKHSLPVHARSVPDPQFLDARCLHPLRRSVVHVMLLL